MPPIDPRLVKAKRFPVHAAVCLCEVNVVKRLLDEDARFHLPRKMPDTELSIVHSACSMRHGSLEVTQEILKYLIQIEASLNDEDAQGQTPLFYAVAHRYAEVLVPLLLEAGAKVNVKRHKDAWTALHLAVLLGKAEVVKQLVVFGDADVHAQGQLGVTPTDLAIKQRLYQLADFMTCPRHNFAPESTILPEIFDELIDKVDQRPLKIKEDLIAWRDVQGNSMIHVAAWNGDLALVRAVCDSIKARKLVALANLRGATPLALAIISGQAKIVEELFMNKHSKKLLDLGCVISETKENIVHLFFRYITPFVHPKFVLKRKDLTKAWLNATDQEGLTPILDCAVRNNSFTISRILSNKSISENNLLDLSTKTKDDKTLFYYLLQNNDCANFKQLINRADLDPDLFLRPTSNGMSGLSMCLNHINSTILLYTILENPNLVLTNTSSTTENEPSLLHVLAEKGELDLWKLALHKCDINAKDSDGNTPLMKVISCGRFQMAEACLSDQEVSSRLDLAIKNNEGNNLVMLCIQHMDGKLFDLLLSHHTDSVKQSINNTNGDGNTALHLAAAAGKWSILQRLLENQGLRPGLDIHKPNREGHSCLVLILLARLKLTKMEQTHVLKKEQKLAQKVKEENELLWHIVKAVLECEKESHGPTMINGRDGGKACLKKQMASSNLIRAPTWDAVTAEFAKLYATPLRKVNRTKSDSGQEVKEVNELDQWKGHGALGPKLKLVSQKSTDEVEKKVPLITLDDLRDPAAFEAMVNNVTNKINGEKKKVVKKKSSNLAKRSSLALDDDEQVPEEATKEDEPPKTMMETLSVTPDNLGNGAIGEGTKSPDREWSPTPTPRRRTPSFKAAFKNSLVLGDKPPRPEGPSPPPPDENDTDDKFRFAAKVEEVMEKVIPRRNEVIKTDKNDNIVIRPKAVVDKTTQTECCCSCQCHLLLLD